ncbi:MAG: hypothetical protein R3Y64_06490 [Peptostreptococcaceae bacterium]
MKKCNCECCRKNRQLRGGRRPNQTLFNNTRNCENLVDRTEQIIGATEFKSDKLVKELESTTNNLDQINLDVPVAELGVAQVNLLELKDDLDCVAKTLQKLSDFIQDVDVPDISTPIATLSDDALILEESKTEVDRALDYARFIDDKLLPKLKCSFDSTVNCFENNGCIDDDDFCCNNQF